MKRKATKKLRIRRAHMLFFLCALVAMFEVALYFGHGILWFVFYAFFGVGLLDAAALLFASFGFVLTQSLSTDMTRTGGQVSLGVKAPRGVRLNCTAALRIVARRRDGGPGDWSTQELAAYTRGFFTTFSPPHMGEYECGVSQAVLFSPLGLFSLSCKPGARLRGWPQRFAALPRRLDVPYAVPLPTTLEISDDQKPQAAHGSDPDTVSGTRGYEYGDALKTINWKKTAATQKLMVKQFDSRHAATAGDVYLGALHEHTPALIQLAAEAAYSIAAYYLHASAGGTLFRDCQDFGAVSRYTGASLDDLARRLASYDPRARVPAEREIAFWRGLSGESTYALILGRAPSGEGVDALCGLPAGSVVALCGEQACALPDASRARLRAAGLTVLLCQKEGELECV